MLKILPFALSFICLMVQCVILLYKPGTNKKIIESNQPVGWEISLFVLQLKYKKNKKEVTR